MHTRNPNHPSSPPADSKQKYSKKKLLAVDSKTGVLEVDAFFIPSCCVCQIVPSAFS